MNQIMYFEKPKDFSSRAKVVGCYVEHNGKFLFLQYVDAKFQGRWGVPAGKMQGEEEPIDTALREIYEETKIWLSEQEVQLVSTIYFRDPYDYTYYVFKVILPTNFSKDIVLSSEHQNYTWVSYQEASNLSLVFGAKEALEHYIKITKRIERHKIISSVYLMLNNGGKYLLYLRQNSGFEDGNYGLVAGHIEYGESAKQAIIREALEEANIILHEEDLHFAHLSCRYSDRENIDIFFECNKWQGEVRNNEPYKCKELKFFNKEDLPVNIIPYIRDVISLSARGIRYSEIGWCATLQYEAAVAEEYT